MILGGPSKLLIHADFHVAFTREALQRAAPDAPSGAGPLGQPQGGRIPFTLEGEAPHNH